MKKTYYRIMVFFIIFLICGCVSNKEIEVLVFDDEANKEFYEFRWSKADHSYLQQLIKEFELEELIEESENELEKAISITNWVHNLWKHDGSNQPQKVDPISILRDVRQGERFRCVEYSIVINGSLNALGIPFRIVGLKTKDEETRKSGAGHVVVEAYLEELNKWIMIDGQWNIIPAKDGTP